MYKKIIAAVLSVCLCLIPCVSAFAQVGDMGFFGGIIDGAKLPKTTEQLLAQTSTRAARNRSTRQTYQYKELIFLSGSAEEFIGLMDVTTNGGITADADVGSYTKTYRVYSSAATGTTPVINRTQSFTVNWYWDGTQVIEDYVLRSWTESITTSAGTFALDRTNSYFNVSIIEDYMPAVTYYRGDFSQRAVYTSGGNPVTLDSSGSFYGYSCPWSNTETHRIDSTIYTNDWQLQYQVRPSVTVKKTLQYAQNEPTIISFEGNFREVMQNESGLRYDIFIKPHEFSEMPDSGQTSISTYNTFEQLSAPDLSFLKGHVAESDIKKLFSMGILSGTPKNYQPAQSISRGEFITALIKAVKLPIEDPAVTAKSKTLPIIVFTDVLPDNPFYPYANAAYDAGIAVGRTPGKFDADQPIQRQELIASMMRALGLSNLGLDPVPVTKFVDDADIASWAKAELYAAERIGLVYQDANGKINPKALVSKAEAAALLNFFIDYMRETIALDYADHIVNF